MKKNSFDTSDKEDLGKRLDEINKRLGRDVEPKDENQGPKRTGNAGLGLAFRLATEFVSAILVGFAIGYGIDWLAGTTPWVMIFFLLFGFVAGVMNILRVAGEMSGSYELTSAQKNGNLEE